MKEATKTAILKAEDNIVSNGDAGKAKPATETAEHLSSAQGEPVVESPRTEGEEPKPALSPKKRRPVVGLILLAIAVTIGAVGYFKRHAVLDAIRARTGAAPVETTKAGSKVKVLYWVDAMNPTQRYDHPGKAPDGMDLVPVYDEGSGTVKNLPEGAFRISPEKQQLIGVTYGEAKLESVSRTIRAVGRLSYDETKIARVHTKIEGWIDKVFVDFTGKLVQRGQPLISIYSPDLVQSQQEYLLAIKGNRELGESDFPEVEASAQSLLQSARQRLQLWDITDEQIKELEERGTPTKDLTLYSPVDGFVVSRNAYPKQRVTTDSELYTIADLSTIWVMADVYEYEAQNIQVGQNASVTLSYLPDRKFTGKISYIYPQVDATTRTLKVRVEVPNPDFTLKPDMYANVDLRVDYGRRVVVPQEAVLDSGSGQTVFVALGDGYFEPRTVKLGQSANGMAIVLEGLKPGEKVVTSANFLVDSESKLKSAMGGMGMPGMSGGEGAKEQPRGDRSQHQPGGPSMQPSPQQSPKGKKTMVMPDGSTMVMPDESAKKPEHLAGHSAQETRSADGHGKPPGAKTMVMPDGSTMPMPDEPSTHEVAPADHSGHQAPQQHSAHEHKTGGSQR